MDQQAICAVCKPYYRAFVEVMQESFGDYDGYVIPAGRPVLLGARPKITSCCLAARMAERFGRDKEAAIRVQNLNGMEVVVIRGSQFDVGLRFKKLDRNYRTSNHVSHQQTVVRQEGRYASTLFADIEVPTAHVCLGYRCTEGLEPRLRDVAITSEGADPGGEYFVQWWQVIWTQGDGFDPRQTFTPPLPMPDKPTFGVKPKRKPGTGRQDSKDGTGG